MEHLYALDFDGVICDSCGETAISALKAAKLRWPALFDGVDSTIEDWIVEQKITVRPVVETGYETLLLVRLLLETRVPSIRKSSVAEGLTVEGILEDWLKLKPVIMEEWNEKRDDLIELFGKVRDEWLEKDFTGWIGANRLYPGVSDALKFASSRVYIVTTKQPLPSTSTAKGAEARSNTIWKQKNQVLWFPPLPLLNPFYFVTRNYDMGRAVWDEMHHKGCCPDDNSYTVFIGGLIRQGRPDEACKYLEEMMEKGMKAPQLDYNKFGADFSKNGNPGILEELARKMNFAGLLLSFILSIYTLQSSREKLERVTFSSHRRRLMNYSCAQANAERIEAYGN